MNAPALVDLAKLTPEVLAANLDNPMWRLSNLYKIIVKTEDEDDDDGLVLDFKPNRAQCRLLERLWHRNVILKARQLGFCLDPKTRVLTADLRWVPIADLKAGDEVVACDENVPGGRGSARKMRTATVQAAAEVHRMAYRIRFDDGREVVCTAQHPWLSRKVATDCKWRSLDGTGNNVSGRLKVGTQVRWVTKPWEESTYEDGWFGGMLDGEGSIAKRNTSASLNVSQREGPVWERLLKYAADRGYNACVEADQAERPSKFGKARVPKLAFGRMDELFRLIGQTRPTRFLGNRFWEGRELPGKRNGDVGWAKIVSIEPLGEQTMIDLQTSTGTYIAEGFVSHNTTLIAILWLDTALFSKSPIRCGIIAQDKDAAESIFTDKVKFAYDNLPEELLAKFPLARNSASELKFAHNGASIRVATSMRSRTIHRLHVSEFGKICAKYPDKAAEVVTGSIPAVPSSGILVIESTAEGREGEFYKIAKRSQAKHEKGEELGQKDYRFHFFPWWEAPDYVADPDLVNVTSNYSKYFDEVEAKIGRELSAEQRAWYVATCEGDFSGDQSKMWQEYPSYPDEAFQVSTEGCYFSKQLATARKGGRILKRIPIENMPVHTFWDVGRRDGCAIWFLQRVGMENRFIGYYEARGEELIHYVKHLRKTGYLFGTHYLPHDAEYKRLGENEDTNKSILEMLEGLMPGERFEIVPKVSIKQTAIEAVRNVFPSCFFMEEDESEDRPGCSLGLQRLENYKKTWDATHGCWRDTPVHDENSEGADAFQQFALEVEAGNQFRYAGRSSSSSSKPRSTNWRTA